MGYVKQYKCPECGEYGDAKLWDEETIKHYDEDEIEYIQSIESDSRNNCEYYCFNCKSLVNGKNIIPKNINKEVDKFIKCRGHKCKSFSQSEERTVCKELTCYIGMDNQCNLLKRIQEIRDDLVRKCRLFEDTFGVDCSDSLDDK